TEQLVIAVNEACMNVIQHAYHDQPTGEMILEIHNNAGSISFHLVDFAEPVDPTTIRPRDLNDLRPGGLGTHFIREIMDKYEMEPLENDQGNILRMVKKINQVTSD
ncbi:MAG: ATP-binding protein, partial [Gammaproteobacteria bacterium]